VVRAHSRRARQKPCLWGAFHASPRDRWLPDEPAHRVRITVGFNAEDPRHHGPLPPDCEGKTSPSGRYVCAFGPMLVMKLNSMTPKISTMGPSLQHPPKGSQSSGPRHNRQSQSPAARFGRHGPPAGTAASTPAINGVSISATPLAAITSLLIKSARSRTRWVCCSMAAARIVGVKMPMPYVPRSCRNQGTEARTVAHRLRPRNSAR
jgi:hypothetical protein